MPPIARLFSSNASLRLRVAALLLATSASLPAGAHETWTLRPSNLLSGSSNPTRATYAGGRFLLFGSQSTYWHSAAGTAAWSFATLPSAPSFFSVSGAVSNGGKIVVTGTNNTLYWTTDTSVAGLPGTAIAWTKLNPVSRGGSNPDLYSVRYANGQFVVGVQDYNAGGDAGNYCSEFLVSTDGETWTSKKIMQSATVAPPQFPSGFTFKPRDFAFRPGDSPGTGTWVAVTDSSNGVFRISEDFSSASFVQITSPSLGTSVSKRIVYAAGLFVMVTANNGRLLTSPDGTTWTDRTSALPAAAANLNDVYHDGERFVVVGSAVTGSDPARPLILHSGNGTAWTEASDVPATPNTLTGVIRADGLWLATGLARVVVTSGSASVSVPEFTSQPSPASANAGGSVLFSATVTGTPAPTFQWLRNNVPLSDGALPSGATVSGATTASLTITGLTLADSGYYFLRATNHVHTTDSTQARLSVSASANGAVLTPYGEPNTGGGQLIPGATPAKAVIGGSGLRIFTVGGGIEYKSTFVNPTSYTSLGGINTSGTKALLGASSSNIPLMVYDLVGESWTLLPAFPLPSGPVTAINYIIPGALADNGDVAGIVQDQAGQNRAFHYAAATETYTLLGTLPNGDIASNPGGISADGQSISGYERTFPWDGPFVWTTSDGFTRLPDPPGGAANGDVRGISPNGRWIVGYGSVPPTGQSALRWDRGTPFGSPTVQALPRRAGDTFADAFTVNDDGTAAGNVRQGFSFSDNRAAVWLPGGGLVVLPNYLTANYGLNLSGFTLNQVTSISADRRTIAGTGTNAANPSLTEGWILTLPDPIVAAPDLTVLRASTPLGNGATHDYGMKAVGSTTALALVLRNDGLDSLTDLALSIVGTNAADFELDPDASSFPTTLGVAAAANLTVRFSPQPGPDGPRTATLTIASNDPDENPFEVHLTGTVTSASLAAFSDYLISANVPEDQRGELDDADSDGLSNLLEFALGLPPMQGGNTMPEAKIVGDHLELTYTQQPHVDYTVEAPVDLSSGPWSSDGVEQGTPDGDGTTTARIPLSAGRGFLRLKISLQP